MTPFEEAAKQAENLISDMTLTLKESWELNEWAWSIIANAGGGNWQKENVDWMEAACEWRDRFHALLDRTRKKADGSAPDPAPDQARINRDWRTLEGSLQVRFTEDPSAAKETEPNDPCPPIYKNCYACGKTMEDPHSAFLTRYNEPTCSLKCWSDLEEKYGKRQ